MFVISTLTLFVFFFKQTKSNLCLNIFIYLYFIVILFLKIFSFLFLLQFFKSNSLTSSWVAKIFFVHACPNFPWFCAVSRSTISIFSFTFVQKKSLKKSQSTHDASMKKAILCNYRIWLISISKLRTKYKIKWKWKSFDVCVVRKYGGKIIVCKRDKIHKKLIYM